MKTRDSIVHCHSFLFQKWLDIVAASADDWPISANDDSECILLQQEINFGPEISVIQCLKSSAYPTKGKYREAALPVLEMIGNNWKAEDSLQW